MYNFLQSLKKSQKSDDFYSILHPKVSPSVSLINFQGCMRGDIALLYNTWARKFLKYWGGVEKIMTYQRD